MKNLINSDEFMCLIFYLSRDRVYKVNLKNVSLSGCDNVSTSFRFLFYFQFPHNPALYHRSPEPNPSHQPKRSVKHSAFRIPSKNIYKWQMKFFIMILMVLLVCLTTQRVECERDFFNKIHSINRIIIQDDIK